MTVWLTGGVWAFVPSLVSARSLGDVRTLAVVLGSAAIMGAVHLLAVQGHVSALLRRRLTRGARSVGVGSLLASGSSLGVAW
jgi:ABC-type uncharacterized transport system permease subunit